MTGKSSSSGVGAVEAARGSYFEEIPLFVSVLDRDLRIVDSNRRFREQFGDGTGKHCCETCRGQEEKCRGCVVEETFLSGEEKSGRETFRDGTGRELPVLIRTAPFRDAAGKPTLVLLTAADVSEFGQLEEQLTSLTLLVGSIAHEIKGVLATLDGGTYIVNSGLRRDDHDRVKEGWDIVQRNIDQMREMVLQVLDYAKNRDLKFSTIDGHRFAQEVLTKMEYRADVLRMELDSDLDPEVGEFEADEGALRGALANILGNALDARWVDESKGGHRVSFSLSGGKDELIFTVLDNGIGMDDETRERALSLPYSSSEARGTDLGLFISNKIVQQHGGSLSVSSTPGVGSGFTVRIPRSQREGKPAPPELRSEDQASD